MNDTLRIEFDRGDRTYRSGEAVRGEVIIYSDHGEACGSVHLMRYWRTHGRGNSDRGDRRVTTIHEGPLEGVPPYRVTFEFEAPTSPFTYRGTLLNVDHYVEARADLPGLFDPGLPEEYVVVPGVEIDPPHPDLLKVTGSKSSGTRGCRTMIGALLILFGFFTLPFGVILMIPGAFLAFPMLTRALAGVKVGTVTSGTSELVVPPGREVRVQARFRPKKATTINAATAVLRGREVVISGKGSDREIHEHQLWSREIGLSGPRELAGGRKAVLDGEVEIPELGAYTFTSEHNEVTWDVQVSVDIPSWPDWHQAHKVIVWPPRPGKDQDGVLEAPADVRKPRAPVDPGNVVPVPPSTDPVAADAREGIPLEPSSPARTPSDSRDVGRGSPGGGDLAAAVEVILERKAFGGGRDPLVRELVGSRFTFDLEVGLVKHTFGAGPDPTYRHGRTVTGRVADSGIPVEVRFPADRNEEVDEYRRGTVYSVTGTVVDWEKLSEKPVLEA